jgi:hypothetical protein
MNKSLIIEIYSLHNVRSQNLLFLLNYTVEGMVSPKIAGCLNSGQLLMIMYFCLKIHESFEMAWSEIRSGA